MYHFIERLYTLYGLLQDEKSKNIFLARFSIDMEKSRPNIEYLSSFGSFKDSVFTGQLQPLKDVLKKLNREHKKILLYGAGETGKFFAGILQQEHIDFYGFCGQEAEMLPDGLMGKPVLSPDELIAHKDEYYVMMTISSLKAHEEVSEFLRQHNYPEEQFLGQVPQYYFMKDPYFEFPELYRRGTAFVDGGCFNCETSRSFAKWCGGAYSSIIAFEPDPTNYAKCCDSIRDVPLPNFQLVNAGLSSQESTAEFDAQSLEMSRFILPESSPEYNIVPQETKNKILVRTVALDDIVGDRTVGFIKLDIEGTEFDALHGAKNTILRDKPLLAICVYHLRGDLFAIMDYLHQLLPEYRFLLRHYYLLDDAETVLYASVDL